MRILVTGGAGFIGSHLVDALVARKDEVTVIDNLSRGEVQNLPSSANFIEGDVRDSAFFQKICGEFKPDVIHHLAAVNGTKRFHEEASLVVDVNVNGTINAIDSAKNCGAKLIFYSSPEAFGEVEKMPISNASESVFTPAHLHQRHSYGSSKYIGEILCQYAVRAGQDICIVRPFNAYGPRLRGDANGQVVSMMLQSNPIIIHGDGSQTRSFTWIGDVVEALLKINDATKLSGSSFNLGSEEEISIQNLADLISKKTGSKIEYGDKNHGDSLRRKPDVSMNKAIDWSAKTSIEDGLNQLL